MAYNNGFPVGYNPYQPYQMMQNTQPMQQATQPQTPQSNSIIWVQGEAGAKSYLVAPNNTVQLWDSESQTIYLKSADASGMPSMKILDYTIRETNRNPSNFSSATQDGISSIYATKDEIKVVSDRITAISERLDKIAKEEES